MHAGRRLRRPAGWRRAVRVAAAGVGIVVLALLAVVAEPTLLRPLIQHVVQSRSGRTIDFSALRIGLDGRLGPWLEFDELTIANAPWAASREPLVRARRVGLDLTWSGLGSGAWVVRRLVLEDGAVDLERASDGRRNSRLSDTEGRGPAHVLVLSVDGRRSRLQMLDAMTGFELRIASAPLAAPRTVAGLDPLPLTRTLTFEGVERGTPFSGQADVSDLLTLQQTGERFALQGEIRSAAARLTVVGAVADLQTAGQIDADLHLAADPLSDLHPGLRAKLPPLRDVVVDAHLVHDDRRWQFSRLQARSRGSALDGTIELRRPAPAASSPRIDATLHATRLDVDELHAADGAQTARTVAGKAAGPASTRTDTPGHPPAAAFDWRGLRGVDAEVELEVAELVAGRSVVARGTRAQATLAQGRLRLVVADARLLGGHGSADLRLDADGTPASASLAAQVAGVQLGELPPAWRAPLRQVSGGSVRATASLDVRGDSPAEWLGSASGSVRASLDGASVSSRLEAELGLDGFAFLRSLLSGADVPLRCAAVELELQRGRGTLRRLVVDTPRTVVAGSGSVDLVHRTLDVVLAPASHVGAVFTLDRDIRIDGPFAKPRVRLQAARSRAAAAACPAGG